MLLKYLIDSPKQNIFLRKIQYDIKIVYQIIS